jgi:hypothetical protein
MRFEKCYVFQGVKLHLSSGIARYLADFITGRQPKKVKRLAPTNRTVMPSIACIQSVFFYLGQWLCLSESFARAGSIMAQAEENGHVGHYEIVKGEEHPTAIDQEPHSTSLIRLEPWLPNMGGSISIARLA